MFFSDRHQAIREMLRVLKPQGRLAVVVWDSLANIPADACEVGLLERVVGKPAADALRAPFVLGDHNQVATLFEQAGTDSVTVMLKKSSVGILNFLISPQPRISLSQGSNWPVNLHKSLSFYINMINSPLNLPFMETLGVDLF